MNRITFFYILAVIIVTIRCNNPQELGSNELLKWYNNHTDQFLFAKEINGIKYSLKLIPNSVLIAKSNQLDSLSLDSIPETDFNYIFNISSIDKSSILYKGTQSQSEYFERANYYAFDVAKDFKLMNSADTAFCVGVHFERSYELTPYITLNVVFDASNLFKQKKDIFFEYTDHVFNTGKIKLKIPYKNIHNIPKLSF